MQSHLYQLVKDNRPLFWSQGDDQLQDLPESSIVETILNLGTLESVKKLFNILGLEKVAQIFQQQISAPRHNYYPPVSHFFNLYFQRHVPKYSQF